MSDTLSKADLDALARAWRAEYLKADGAGTESYFCKGFKAGVEHARRAPGPATSKLITAAKWFRTLCEQWGRAPERDGSDYSRLWADFSKDIDDAEHEPAKAEGGQGDG